MVENRSLPAESDAAIRHGYCVVLTACVTPSPGALVARANPSVRLNDYLEGLRFWLTLPDRRIRRIVFLENSGHSLEPFRDLVARENHLGKEIELLSIECGAIPEGLDYGFAESEMLETGVARSHLCQKSKFLIKATGRLKFDGLSELLDALPEDYDFVVEARTWRFHRRMEVPWVQAQLLLFSTEFFTRHVAGVRHRMVPGANLEAVLSELLLSFRGNPGAILRWPRYVALRGVSGFSGVPYDSFKKRAGDRFRIAVRSLAPGWWI